MLIAIAGQKVVYQSLAITSPVTSPPSCPTVVLIDLFMFLVVMVAAYFLHSHPIDKSLSCLHPSLPCPCPQVYQVITCFSFSRKPNSQKKKKKTSSRVLVAILLPVVVPKKKTLRACSKTEVVGRTCKLLLSVRKLRI